MSAPDESLVPAITPPGSTLTTGAQSTVAAKQFNAYTINETLHGIVEKMQNLNDIAATSNHNYADWYAQAEAGLDTHDTGWWEAYSHGLVMPLDGDFRLSGREQDKGFYDKLRTIPWDASPDQLMAKYLELETDFLRFDDKGLKRQYDENYPQPIEIGTLPRTQSLSLRVIAFTQLRAQLSAQGFEVHENPVMAEAIAAVKEGIAKFDRPGKQLTVPLESPPHLLEERPIKLE